MRLPPKLSASAFFLGHVQAGEEGVGDGSWFNEKSYPSIPYLFNLLMDPMEKMDPESHEWGYVGRKFVAAKLWAPTAAGPFLAAHLKSLDDFPPSQGADTLSMKKAIDEAMKKLEPKGR